VDSQEGGWLTFKEGSGRAANGGYGFHPGNRNIQEAIRNVDADKIRRELNR
jgi:hypothetical protein